MSCISVNLSIHPSNWHYVHLSTSVTLIFSVPMIARIIKPCIELSLTCYSNTHLYPVSLTYISCFIDFVRILHPEVNLNTKMCFSVLMVARVMKQQKAYL